MSGHADTIRRERESRHWTNEQRREAWGEHWPAESGKREGDADRAVDALLAENQRLQETLRLREQEQIPMIPTGAKRKMDSLEAENQRLREAALYARATLRGMLSDPNVTRSIDLRPEIEMLDRALAGEKEPDAMP